MLEQRIQQHFYDSADLKYQSAERLGPRIAAAVEACVAALSNGNKILACGNGGSAADAQHFAAELVGRFERERPELAAIALSTDSSVLSALANDYGYEQVFAKQVRALGQPGDVLLAISTSGKSPSVIEAVKAAKERDMTVIALSGKGGGRFGELLSEEDVHVVVASSVTARIQEVHILALHCLCDGIDWLLLGESAEAAAS
jgi:D-sedoheptulose 7-phosphate isomerase